MTVGSFMSALGIRVNFVAGNIKIHMYVYSKDGGFLVAYG